MMEYFEFVGHLLDLLRVSNHTNHDYFYAPRWLGVVLVYVQVFGMGLFGLLTALWMLFKRKSAGMGLFYLLLFTFILPFVYGLLTSFFIDFSSHCGGGMIYFCAGPLCALPGSIPAWLIFVMAWISLMITKLIRRRGNQSQQP